MHKKALLCAIAMTAFAAPVVIVSTVSAAAYPGTKCVSDKLKAASGNCKAVFSAWAKFAGGGESDAVKRDDALAKAAGKMTASWTKSETKAADKGADCVDTTLTDAEAQTLITNAVAAVYADVTGGLTLSNKDHAKCASTLIKESGAKCAAILKAQGGYVGKLAAGKSKRDASITKADGKFDTKVTDALAGCPSTATLASLDAATEGVTNDIYTNSILSPNVDDTVHDDLAG
jgi:hypothetical protein